MSVQPTRAEDSPGVDRRLEAMMKASSYQNCILSGKNAIYATRKHALRKHYLFTATAIS
jgi:hypothetical protein